MKRLLTIVLAITAFGIMGSNAQVYTGAVGLGLDFGDGQTLVGPSGKYFFAPEHAGQAEVLFGDGVTFIQLMYAYHGEFSGADGLQWYAGAGPSFGIASGDSAIGIRPLVGLDYKIAEVPLAFSFDWRPAIFFESGSDFEPARFAFGFRYAFD
jgi:hypothetical protein